MAIYLDANVIWPWRTFAEVERLALSIVANQIGQQVFVPQVAAREAEEGYRRSLEAAVEAYDVAVRGLGRHFDQQFDVHVEPMPQPDDATAIWRRRLDAMGSVIPLDAEDAAVALDREITGTPPARERVEGKPGSGARDAAIWLTAVRHHLAGDEEGHFISQNRRDFAGSDNELKPELLADVEGAKHPMHYYVGIGEFLARLGVQADAPPVGLEDLRRRVEPVLGQALRDAPDLPAAVWNELDPESRYRTVVKQARPVRVISHRRYEREGEAVALVNAAWELVVDCLFQERATETPQHWSGAADIAVSGNIQVYLPEHEGEDGQAQHISSQFHSDTTLWVAPSGDVMGVTGL